MIAGYMNTVLTDRHVLTRRCRPDTDMNVVVTACVSALLAAISAGSPNCLRPPVDARIASRFVAPSCPYCAGHRTLDFAAIPGAEVTSPVDGTVTFVGMVAGSTYITIAATDRTGVSSTGSPDLQSSSYLVTLGGVTADPDVTTGRTVVSGRRIGTASTAIVRLSLRRIIPGGEAEYLDPENSLVRRRAPVRLVPEPGTLDGRIVTTTRSCRNSL